MTTNFITVTNKSKNTNLNYKLVNAGGNHNGCLQVIINIKKHQWEWLDDKSNWYGFITEISNLINKRRVNIYKNLPNIRNSMHSISVILGEVNMKVNSTVYNIAYNDRINIIEKIYEIMNKNNNNSNNIKADININKSKFDIFKDDTKDENSISSDYTKDEKSISSSSNDINSWASKLKTKTTFNKSAQLIKKEKENLENDILNTYDKLLNNDITKILINYKENYNTNIIVGEYINFFKDKNDSKIKKYIFESLLKYIDLKFSIVCYKKNKINNSYISIIAPTNISTYKLLELIGQWYIKFKYNTWINEKLDHIEESKESESKESESESKEIEFKEIEFKETEFKETEFKETEIDDSIKKPSFLDTVLATIDNTKIDDEYEEEYDDEYEEYDEDY